MADLFRATTAPLGQIFNPQNALGADDLRRTTDAYQQSYMDTTKEVRAQGEYDNRMNKQAEDKKLSGLSAMLKDPQNAEYIGSAYGIEVTPEIKMMLAEPEKSQKLIEYTDIARKMGLDAEGASMFVKAGIETNDPIAAAKAVEGYVPRRNVSLPRGYGYSNGSAFPLPGVNPNDVGTPPRRPAAPRPGKSYVVNPAVDKVITKTLNEKLGAPLEFDPNNFDPDLYDAPLDNESMMALRLRASEIYQQTGNPVLAADQAVRELAGEDMSGFGAGQPTGATRSTGIFSSEPIPYRTLPKAGGQGGRMNQVVPQMTPIPPTITDRAHSRPSAPAPAPMNAPASMPPRVLPEEDTDLLPKTPAPAGVDKKTFFRSAWGD